MSEVQRDADIGAILGFLSRVLRMEMHELWSDYRPHHFQQSKKESGGPRASGRCDALGSCRTGSDTEPAGTQWWSRLITGILSIDLSKSLASMRSSQLWS